MANLLADTETFLRAADHPIPDVPALPSTEVLALRLSLLLEELSELFYACGLDESDAAEALQSSDRTGFLTEALKCWGMKQSLVEMVDAYHDITVIAHGGALESAGEAADATAAEVARSNLDKIVDGKVLRRSDGKILKPDGWQGPDLRSALRDHGWEG